jgi:hypothetical protein
MSLPPAPMPMGLMSAPNAVINPLEMLFMSINTNPYFIGLMMLLLNMGGRFLPMEISKEQEKVLQNPWLRKVLIFVVLFVATRNVFVAFIGSIIIMLFLGYLLNENSSLYLWKLQKNQATETKTDSTPVPGLTPEEADILRRLNEKQLRMSAAAAGPNKTNTDTEQKTDEEIPLEDIYAFNLYRLRT